MPGDGIAWNGARRRQRGPGGDNEGPEETTGFLNRVDVGDYSPSTSHCTVRTGLVYGATYI